MTYGVGLVAKGENESAADLWVRGAGASIETLTVSCCSWHAAARLPNKEEEAKEDDEKHERERHGIPIGGMYPGRISRRETQANQRWARLSRATTPHRSPA